MSNGSEHIQSGSERERIIQSNEIAEIIIRSVRETNPDLFVTLNLRYGIADAIWNAGYRKVSS